MTRLPEPDPVNLRDRYPDVFDRPLSSRLAIPAMLLGAFGIFVFGLVELEFSPARMLAGLNQLGWITMMMIPPDPGSSLPAYLVALGETLSIALLGTTLAALFALPVSLLAARNIVPSNIFRFPVRRFLNSIRGVDTLIWALVWINVVGLGPFAGVLAIAVADFGAFGKLFSEAIEAADKKQVEGIRASGGNALHEIRFGLMPQVLPVIAGQVLYFIESNTRSATIIGIVGAGGIGLQLAEQIRVLEWQKVSFLILMILVAVAAIDWISGKLRFAIIGQRAIVTLLRRVGKGALAPCPPSFRIGLAMVGTLRFAHPASRQLFSTKNSTRSAAKRERLVVSGSPAVSTSVLSTTSTGRPSARSSRAASVASTIAAVIRVDTRRKSRIP